MRYNLGSISSLVLDLQLRQGAYVSGGGGYKMGSCYCLLFVEARCFLVLDHALMGNNRPHGR